MIRCYTAAKTHNTTCRFVLESFFIYIYIQGFTCVRILSKFSLPNKSYEFQWTSHLEEIFLVFWRSYAQKENYKYFYSKIK